MKNLKRNLLIAVAAVVTFLGLRGCLPEPPSFDVLKPLLPTESARIVVEDNKVSVLGKDGVKATYVPPSGRAVVTVDKAGNTKVAVKSAGFKAELGGSVLYVDEIRAGIDCQFAYWNRLSLLGGVAFGRRPVVVPYLAVAYRLDQLKLKNTFVFVGITPRKDYAAGLRVAF